MAVGPYGTEIPSTRCVASSAILRIRPYPGFHFLLPVHHIQLLCSHKDFLKESSISHYLLLVFLNVPDQFVTHASVPSKLLLSKLWGTQVYPVFLSQSSPCPSGGSIWQSWHFPCLDPLCPPLLPTSPGAHNFMVWFLRIPWASGFWRCSVLSGWCSRLSPGSDRRCCCCPLIQSSQCHCCLLFTLSLLGKLFAFYCKKYFY